MPSRFDPLVAEWAAFASDERYSLAERALKLAQLVEYPRLDIAEYVGRLAGMRESFRLARPSSRDARGLVRALNSHVFGTCGFHGDFEDHYDPRNNFLNDVIDRRSGIAITISIIYAEVARGAGMHVGLVGFPGRVLASYEGIILDPLSGGRALGEEGLRALLRAGFGDAELEPRMLEVAEPARLLVRIARNLKHSYIHSYAHERALRCARMALAISPDSAEDTRDAGLMEARLLNPGAALEHLSRYLELNPNGDDVDSILEIMRQMRASR